MLPIVVCANSGKDTLFFITKTSEYCCRSCQNRYFCGSNVMCRRGLKQMGNGYGFKHF